MTQSLNEDYESATVSLTICKIKGKKLTNLHQAYLEARKSTSFGKSTFFGILTYFEKYTYFELSSGARLNFRLENFY